MYFLISTKYQFVFATTPKAGCQHINFLFNYIHGQLSQKPFLFGHYLHIPKRYQHYQVVVFVRNPYERIISGFREKYGKKNYPFKGQNNQLLTFHQFVNELYDNHYRVVDKHHFQPQTDYAHTLPPNIKVFDIKVIDYQYIETLCGKTIPSTIRSKKGGHIDKTTCMLEETVIHKPLGEYLNLKVSTHLYYDKDLQDKIRQFYAKDFAFAKKHGLDFKIC